MVSAPPTEAPEVARVRGDRARRTRLRTLLIGALVAVLLAEVAVRVIAGPLPDPQIWSTPEMQYKVGQITERGDTDVLLVGSSVIDVGLDPERIGDNAYNGALGAGSLGMIADFTEHVAVPELDPRVVVVGISAREINAFTPTVAAHESEFYGSPAVKEALGTESLLDQIDRRLRDLSYLFRYRTILRDPSNWVSPSESWGPAVTRDDGLYLGFRDVVYEGDPAVAQNLAQRSIPNFQVGEDAVQRLRELLVELRSAGREVVLVIGPVTQHFVDAFPDGEADYARFASTMEALASEVDAAFLPTGVWEASLMADPVHTNGVGTARFSDLVADAIGR